MNPKKIRDIEPGGYFTINGMVFQVAYKIDGILKMHNIDYGDSITMNKDLSCLPLDRLSAQVLLDRKK